jgi:hypothetical protein
MLGDQTTPLYAKIDLPQHVDKLQGAIIAVARGRDAFQAAIPYFPTPLAGVGTVSHRQPECWEQHYCTVSTVACQSLRIHCITAASITAASHAAASSAAATAAGTSTATRLLRIA